MKKPAKKSTKASTMFESFMDSYVEELLATPDNEILEGKDAKAILREAEEMLNAAQSQAGRSRLARAKEWTKANSGAVRPWSQENADVSMEEAKRFLAQVANDPRYTLAARELADLPDQEVMRLYRQFQLLASRRGSEKGET